MLQHSHAMHPAVLAWENRQITCPDTCPFERGAMETDVPFYNSIIGNFIVYQDRI